MNIPAETSYINGFEIAYDEAAVVATWVFPEDRFIEYEKKDEPWCRMLGVGHEARKPGVYSLSIPPGRNVLLIHPSLKESFEERLRRVP